MVKIILFLVFFINIYASGDEVPEQLIIDAYESLSFELEILNWMHQINIKLDQVEFSEFFRLHNFDFQKMDSFTADSCFTSIMIPDTSNWYTFLLVDDQPRFLLSYSMVEEGFWFSNANSAAPIDVYEVLRLHRTDNLVIVGNPFYASYAYHVKDGKENNLYLINILEPTGLKKKSATGDPQEVADHLGEIYNNRTKGR
ncbi:hypothetical protein QA601_01825 [Chitinispirillales bacterium ANBcel5]|uniref:hypothetical protein n=1 Tax=Cellulosispirillum alkaliphilum TaxID=3039283 RepID=UPI002A57EC79|nr:hypothetical protein [Chitinispirillales bacterium ANBcel5]